jgi:hypothetical protein
MNTMIAAKSKSSKSKSPKSRSPRQQYAMIAKKSKSPKSKSPKSRSPRQQYAMVALSPRQEYTMVAPNPRARSMSPMVVTESGEMMPVNEYYRRRESALLSRRPWIEAGSEPEYYNVPSNAIQGYDWRLTLANPQNITGLRHLWSEDPWNYPSWLETNSASSKRSSRSSRGSTQRSRRSQRKKWWEMAGNM